MHARTLRIYLHVCMQFCPEGHKHMHASQITLTHKQHSVLLSSSFHVPKKKTQAAAAPEKHSLSLNLDPAMLESCLFKLLCSEMTSTSPVEQ